jgi:alpha/beta superfamily hydrolase
MVNNDIIIKNDKTLPKILLIIPFGASNNIFDFFLEKFDDYCLVFFDMNSEDYFKPYLSLKKQSEIIVNTLKSHELDDFKLIFSLSLGGVLAMNIFSKEEISIKHCIIDSTPLLKIDKITRLMAQTKIVDMIKDIDTLRKQHQYIFQKISETAIKTVRNSSLNSLKKLSDDILSFDFPKINEMKQKNLIMRYGTADLSYQSIKTLKSTYRKSTIYVKSNYNHCQEFIEENEKYLEFVKNIIIDNN